MDLTSEMLCHYQIPHGDCVKIPNRNYSHLDKH